MVLQNLISAIFKPTKYSKLTGDKKEYFFLNDVDRQRLPKHVAIIMDGNGRWAKKRGLPRAAGHKAGYQAVRGVVDVANGLGLTHLTLFAFSAENWRRPKEEVDSLMELFGQVIKAELPHLNKNGISLKVIGRKEGLSEKIKDIIKEGEESTLANEGLSLVIALNYSGRSEIVDSIKRIAQRAVDNNLNVDAISEETVQSNLYLPDLPDPDLVIRTSGEERISNFLIWQTAYSEFWTTKKFWPDFTGGDLVAAIIDFQGRKRRFGGLKES